MSYVLTKFDALIALVFTVVEIITLTVWLYFFIPSALTNLGALIFVSIGLYVEHVISRIQKK